MTIQARPFTSVAYSDQDLRDHYAYLHGVLTGTENNKEDFGVLLGVRNDLAVLADSPASADVKVQTGAAWIQGCFWDSDAIETVTVTANATGSTRYDIIYAQYNATTKVGAVGIATGTTSLPTLTQTKSGVYQIPVAYIAVPNGFSTIAQTDIFDFRSFVNVPERLAVTVQNKSAVDLDTGDVVIWNSAVDKSVTTTTTALSQIAGVVEGYIPINGWGRIVVKGIAPVHVGATITRGDKLSQSTVATEADPLEALTSFATALEGGSSGDRLLCYVDVPSIPLIQTTKGDLLVRNNANEIVRQAVGTDLHPLVSNSAVATGIQYGAMSPSGMTAAGVLLYKSGSQSLSSGATTEITFQSEDYDTDAFHTGSNSYITIPSGMGGKYMIFFVIEAVTGSGSGVCTYELRVGSTTKKSFPFATNATIGGAFGYSIMLALSASDTVRLRANITGTTPSIVGGSDSTFLGVQYVGA